MANSIKVDTEMIEEAACSLHSLAANYEMQNKCLVTDGAEGQVADELLKLYNEVHLVEVELVALVERTAEFLDEFCRVTDLSDQQNAENISQ